ncbi:MAG: phosphatidate cytidylyltransferase [Corynebacterium sp.]|nr:phosphatidate cytidylyltransferase [Corynebacterium sp.]
MTSHHSFPKPKNSAGRDLKAAITTGIVLGGLAILGIFFVPYGWQMVVSAFVAMGLWEASKRLNEHGHKIPGPLLIVAAEIMVWVQQFLGPSFVVGTMMVSFLVLCIVHLLRAKHGEFVRDLSISCFLLMWIGLAGVACADIATMTREGAPGSHFVTTVILAIVCNDIGGYVAGVLFGSHPMAPRISPKKSWEGMGGSLVFGIANGVLCSIFLLHCPFWVGIVLGIGIVICATFGDLIESQFKRELGIKDMSQILPGHGGAMDRMDSFLPASMAAWVVMSFIVH